MQSKKRKTGLRLVDRTKSSIIRGCVTDDNNNMTWQHIIDKSGPAARKRSIFGELRLRYFPRESEFDTSRHLAQLKNKVKT